ncbi:MAG: sugar-binding protein [bacterium]
MAIWAVSAVMNGFAQDQFIDCRKLDSSIRITIDGNGQDWPLASYGSPALHQGNGSKTMVTGDHFELDATTAYRNADANNPYEGPEDMSATTYIAWDNEAFYLLDIVRDSEIGFEHANANTIDADGYFTGQSSGYTNDGIELWMDNDNDRLPEQLGSTPNDLQFDMLIDETLQKRDFPNLAPEDYGMTMDNYRYQYKEIYGTSAEYNDNDYLETDLLSQVQVVNTIDADNMGYTMEIRIPFGTFNELTSAHPIGLNISWIDWDKGAFTNFSWDGVLADQPPYFGELRFSSDRPLGGTPVSWWPLFE